MTQPDAYRMIERRGRAAGIKKPRSAITPSAQQGLRITSRAPGHWNTHRRWQTIRRRAPQSCTIATLMRSASTNTSGWGFKAPPRQVCLWTSSSFYIVITVSLALTVSVLLVANILFWGADVPSVARLRCPGIRCTCAPAPEALTPTPWY